MKQILFVSDNGALNWLSFVSLQKKRKQRKRDVDSLSLCSLDINVSYLNVY